MSINYHDANNQLNFLYQQALYFANNAVKEDNIGNFEAAINSYLDFKKVHLFFSSYMFIIFH
jgi:hypothetical protein